MQRSQVLPPPEPIVEPQNDHFGKVDQTFDPQHFVRLLESERDLQELRALKQQSYRLMGAAKGKSFLDVGCGVGEDVRSIAAIVGKTGRSVGVDSSFAMIEAAKKHSAGLEFPGEFLPGDVTQLPFADETFDGCRAERVLQHYSDPIRALNEMLRVLRPGGSIVILDTEFDSIITRLSNPELARKWTIFGGEGRRNRYIVRQLPGLFRQLHLEDIRIVPNTRVTTYNWDPEPVPTQVEPWWDGRGILTPEEYLEIRRDLKQLNESGEAFSMMVSFTIAARKP